MTTKIQILELDFDIEKVTDIMDFGLMGTPALVVNGNVPTPLAVKRLIKEAM